MNTDLDLDALHSYRSAHVDPPDFDGFWARTLAETREHPLDVRADRVSSPLTTVDVHDVSFAGFGGHRIRAWLRTPAGATGPLPGVVEFVGYGGGRGLPEADLLWASLGYAHLIMDTRGQGATWSVGDTPDPDAGSGPRTAGVMTDGIRSPETYYYRRVIADAVRAVEAARDLPVIDADRVVVTGGSQGGALALAAAALAPGVRAASIREPFLCDIARAVTLTDQDPYRELVRFLAVHRAEADGVRATLAHVDGVSFARRATAPAQFSVALMDRICPPSTVFGAYHAYAGEKSIDVWPFNDHEGGGLDEILAAARFFAATLAG